MSAHIPSPSPPKMPSYTEANHSRLNVSNPFSKPGPNLTVIFPSVISMKAHKHLQMEEHRTYNFGMCNAAVYHMKKPVMFIYCCPSCSKTTPLLGKLKKLVRTKVLSTPEACEHYSLNRAVVAVSRVCCCLRVCLLGQFQPKANKMIYHLTSLNLVMRNCRIKHLD